MPETDNNDDLEDDGAEPFNEAMQEWNIPTNLTTRENLIEGYLSVLKRFEDHPRAAEVMLRLAAVHGHYNPKQGQKRLVSGMVTWYQRCMDRAESGSETWARAGRELAMVLRDERRYDEHNDLLQVIRQGGTDDPVIWDYSVKESVRRGDIEAAEEHFLQLINQSNPLTPFRKISGKTLVKTIYQSETLSPSVKIERLTNLLPHFGRREKTVIDMIHRCISKIEQGPKN